MMRWADALRTRPEAAIGLAFTFAIALGYLVARDAPFFESLEGPTLDWRFAVRGPIEPGPETVIVALDERTLAGLGRWPISRAVLARAVEALARDGAAVIGFDLLFIGAEREAEADAALLRAVAAAGNVVVPFGFVFRPTEGTVRKVPEGIAHGAYAVTRAPAGRRPGPRPYPAGLLAPSPDLLAAGIPAHVSVVVDADGVLRNLNPVIGYGDYYFPALPVAAARLFLRLAPADVIVRFGEGLSLGPRRIATTHDMRLPINYYGPAGRFVTHSLIDVIEGRVAAGTFRGRIVLIGATAQGVGDRFTVPFAPAMPGVEIFASATDNLLHGRTFDRSVSVELWDLLAIAVAGLLAAALAGFRSPVASALAGLALAAAWVGIATAAFVAAGVWLSVVFPVAAIAAGTAAASVGQSLRERRGRRTAERAHDRLSRYVSPLTGEHLAGGGAAIPEATARQAAVMAVDMRGFTAASERLPPAETMVLLRAFHQRVERAVAAHRGKIDKFIGDGALVVFGTARPDPADARDALACARDLAGAVAHWNEAREADGQPAVRIGIGLHAGPVVLGEVGGEAHPQVTIAGDTVNVASRLETLAGTHGVTIIASDAVIEAARAAGAAAELDGFVELPMQDIRGRRRPLGAWAWPAPGRGT